MSPPFYVDKLGFKVRTDVRNDNYRWLTVQAMVAKGAMPPRQGTWEYTTP
jgi:hypothetical protein